LEAQVILVGVDGLPRLGCGGTPPGAHGVDDALDCGADEPGLVDLDVVAAVGRDHRLGAGHEVRELVL
jgi:hypothetical protein